METNIFYLDAGLKLTSLATELGIYPNELSRITNLALSKSFSGFVNEYRIKEVILKIQDTAFIHITLFGIAYDSGVKSKTMFNRTFRQFAGKSPADYNKSLQTGSIL